MGHPHATLERGQWNTDFTLCQYKNVIKVINECRWRYNIKNYTQQGRVYNEFICFRTGPKVEVLQTRQCVKQVP
jgi:hypothetical protein